MKLVRVSGRCLRCNQRWTARNAMALAAKHYRKTGHHVEVEAKYGTEAVRRTLLGVVRVTEDLLDGKD